MTFPIILAHGVCRFDQLWSNVLGGLDNCDDESKDMLHYFKGTRSMLVKKGYQVFHAKVPWAAPVDQRAEALRSAVAEILRDSGASKVNIIALILDMAIELPLKTILHLIRQWGVFISNKKDEI